jgi:hypothetical protein
MIDLTVAREHRQWLHLTHAPEAEYRQAALEERQTSSAFTSDRAWAQRVAELVEDAEIEGTSYGPPLPTQADVDAAYEDWGGAMRAEDEARAAAQCRTVAEARVFAAEPQEQLYIDPAAARDIPDMEAGS